MFRLLPVLLIFIGAGWSLAASPNIVFITIDTVRADRMGFLGSDRGLTPNLDTLARQGIVFSRAYAQVPLTTPSHAALLTGTYPQFNHVEDLGAPLAKDLPYLPELLQQKGYQTAAFVGAYILDPGSSAPGFERGFQTYDAGFHRRKPNEDRYQSVERRAEEVANRALGWISQHHKQGPFFVWLHLYDAHDPYDPPPAFKSHFDSAPYDGEIAYVDSVIGSFLSVLQQHGLFQNTVVAVASDHGEAFGEHGEERHGMFLYDETIHVPLLIRLPANRYAGRKATERVALTDVAPTVLQAVGISVPAAMQGRSLIPSVEAVGPKLRAKTGKLPKPEIERPVYSETNYAHRAFGWSILRSWRAGKYLYVQAPKRELYDQAADPSGTQNLADRSKAVAGTLDSQLEEFQAKTSRAIGERAKLDPAQVENLRALGYLASDSSDSHSVEKSLIDPKDKIAIANELHRALVNIEEDHYDEAIAGLRRVIQQEPDSSTGYLELGRALVHERRYAEALPVLRTAVGRMPSSGMAHYELGLALVKTGDWQTALPAMKKAVELTPKSAQLHFYLGAVHGRLKQVPEATAEFEKAIELDPKHFQAHLRYGRLLFLEGNLPGALPRLQKAVEIDPNSQEAHAFLADAYERMGRAADAEQERVKARQASPGVE